MLDSIESVEVIQRLHSQRQFEGMLFAAYAIKQVGEYLKMRTQPAVRVH
jgi:hypothetical protein